VDKQHASPRTDGRLRKDGQPYKTPDRKPSRPSPTQRLLTGQQVEIEYGIPYRSLYDLHKRGTLPAVRFENSERLWFERALIEQLIERSREAVPA
jgi:hypothetical protein